MIVREQKVSEQEKELTQARNNVEKERNEIKKKCEHLEALRQKFLKVVNEQYANLAHASCEVGQIIYSDVMNLPVPPSEAQTALMQLTLIQPTITSVATPSVATASPSDQRRAEKEKRHLEREKLREEREKKKAKPNEDKQ